MKQKITLNIEPSLLASLDKLATIRQTTRSKVLRALVQAWVSEHEMFELELIAAFGAPVEESGIVAVRIPGAIPAAEAFKNNL